LDKITAEVQAFYEAYPYPPDGRVDWDAYHARLLLSYLQRESPVAGPIQVLEAGCGRGMNLLVAAENQPEIDFTGVDINRVAITEAAHRCAEKGLANLRYHYSDLLDRETLPAREGGYQVILSYGVVHHLSNPLQGLRNISRLLAPQGVIALMLDGSFGRQPLDRYLQALHLIDPEQRSNQRVSIARALAAAAETTLFKGNYWQGTATTDEVEFADRCLHVHQNSYDITGLWQLLDAAGLGFVRWLEPNDWEIGRLIDDPDLARQIDLLDKDDQYRLIERLWFRPKLTLLAARRDDIPRLPLRAEQVATTRLTLSPQLSFDRSDNNGEVPRLRGRRVDLDSHPLLRETLSQAAHMSGEFSGQQLIERLLAQAEDCQLITQAILCLVEQDLLYRPHAESADLG
jgi:SAM-dependent methyltransferase